MTDEEIRQQAQDSFDANPANVSDLPIPYLQHEIAKLRTEVERLKADAERYRFLRESNWFALGIIHEAPYGRTAHDTHGHLDDSIDAAKGKS